MSHWKAFGLAIFTAVCWAKPLVRASGCNGTCATEWSSGGKITNLGGLPGSKGTGEAAGIKATGQVVDFQRWSRP